MVDIYRAARRQAIGIHHYSPPLQWMIDKYHMTHTAPHAQSHRKPCWKLTFVRPDGLTWVCPEKAIRPCTNTALLQKLEGKKGKIIGAFLMNCDLFALTRKTQRKIFLIVEYFLLFSGVRPCIASYYGWTKFSKFSTLSGHVIKCLMTDFGLAGRVNMLAAFSPYIMTSSQNFFPCVTFGQFSLFLISPLGVVTLENKKKTSGFLLHSFIIRFISNHSTSYHGYKRMSHP